jgi:hypothetical protein
LNGNLILSKVGEGVFIVQGEKEPFEAEFLHPAGAKSVAPAAEPDQPAHSPAKPDLHRPVTPDRHRASRRRRVSCRGVCRVGQLLRRARAEHPTRTLNR